MEKTLIDQFEKTFDREDLLLIGWCTQQNTTVDTIGLAEKSQVYGDFNGPQLNLTLHYPKRVLVTINIEKSDKVIQPKDYVFKPIEGLGNEGSAVVFKNYLINQQLSFIIVVFQKDQKIAELYKKSIIGLNENDNTSRGLQRKGIRGRKSR